MDADAMPLRVRAASEDDSAFLARAMLCASRGHSGRGLWDIVVEEGEEDRLELLEYLCLLDEPSLCHRANFLIAERGGVPAAAMSAYDPGEPGLLIPGRAIAAAFTGLGLGPQALARAFERLAAYDSGVPRQQPGVWTIEWVWTEPQQRSAGLAGTLLERLLERGRARRYRSAQVTVAIGNGAAVRLYERSGFRFAEERRSDDFEQLVGSAGMARYERAL